MPVRRPGPLPEGDERHGTLKGFYAGCDLECCRGAHNSYERRRRKTITLRGESGLRKPALGARRRVEGLLAMGWTAQEVARECGWENRNDVLSLRLRTWVRPETFATLDRAYRHMSMRTPPPSPFRRRNKAAALRKGWALPFMWDAIDDPGCRPKGRRRDEEETAA